ncbi:MAG: VanW family protein [Patescibacteria group bacterium]
MEVLSKKIEEGKQKRWFLFLIIFIFLITIGAGALVVRCPLLYQGKIYPGISLGGIPVGGLTPQEARERIQQRVEAFYRRGVTIEGFGKRMTILPTVSALSDPDLTYDLIAYDTDAMVSSAMAVGRPSRPGARLISSLIALGLRMSAVDLPAQYVMDIERFMQIVTDAFSTYETPPRNTQLRVHPTGEVNIIPASSGLVIDTMQVRTALTAMLNQFQHSPLTLTLVPASPSLTAAQVQPLGESIPPLLSRAPFQLTLPREWHEPEKPPSASGMTLDTVLTRERISAWLTARRDERGEARLAFAPDRVAEFLKPYQQMIDVPAVDAKFNIKDGKVMEFQASRDGRALDVEATRKAWEVALLEHQQQTVEVVVRESKAKIHTAEVNELGIREVLGTGRSNFSGSPKNRRHNIAIGAAAVNGTLIAPGETFSLLKTLGSVDAAHGYLPELVIKGNKTVPEYGGGLCQIGTTSFRAALAAGMPILERQNHSYRVRYYEPAGTDATIYNPKPDFAFLNDTGFHLLFQTRIEGDDAIFELWGTPDGRFATSTTPVITNIVAPPPTKRIETTELKPGEKKCTEAPHNGANASFTYTVRYPSGEEKVQEFKSHYRPWQEVCLVGVPKPEPVESSPSP